MRRIDKTWLYILFIAPLAFFYEPLKGLMGDGIFYVCGFIYLCVCSFFASYFGKPDKKE